MNNEKKIFIQVEEGVRAVLNTDEGEIKMDSMFRKDLDAESIDFLDISFEIEKRTGVDLDFSAVIEFLNKKSGLEVEDISIRDIVDYLIHAKNSEQVSS